jgi:hypothetical protein
MSRGKDPVTHSTFRPRVLCHNVVRRSASEITTRSVVPQWDRSHGALAVWPSLMPESAMKTWGLMDQLNVVTEPSAKAKFGPRVW